jgi:hypothetical protein
MTNTKNNVPIYQEQQNIHQKIKIPNDFIQLETKRHNHMCSTQG